MRVRSDVHEKLPPPQRFAALICGHACTSLRIPVHIFDATHREFSRTRTTTRMSTNEKKTLKAVQHQPPSWVGAAQLHRLNRRERSLTRTRRWLRRWVYFGHLRKLFRRRYIGLGRPVIFISFTRTRDLFEESLALDSKL